MTTIVVEITKEFEAVDLRDRGERRRHHGEYKIPIGKKGELITKTKKGKTTQTVRWSLGEKSHKFALTEFDERYMKKLPPKKGFFKNLIG